MMKKLTISFFLLFLILVSDAAETVIWATSDMHGNIVSKKGGMLRIASLLQEKRGKNDILIDAGDLWQGSYVANSTNGSTVVNAFNAMNYDVFVPGNHDFEFGKAFLLKNLKSIKTQILSCNFCFDPPLENMKPYTVLERNTFRIGIIGAAERESKYRIMPDTALRFADEALSIGRALKALRKEKVDVIVLVRHGGIYFSGGSLFSLLKLFPEIDIVIGGHSHELERGRKIAGAYYVQPGKFAEGISEIRVDFDKNRKIQRISSLYHDVSAYPVAPAMKNISDAEKSIHKSSYHKFRRKIPANLKNITDVQKYLILQGIENKTVGDAYIFFADKSGLEWRGNLNKYLLYRMFPYENHIVTIPVTVSEFNIILDECRKYSKKYKVPLVSRLKHGNKKHLLLRTTSFVLSGGGRNFPNSRRIAEQKLNEIKYCKSMRLAVTDYLNNDEL